jgi:hypothetical protein
LPPRGWHAWQHRAGDARLEIYRNAMASLFGWHAWQHPAAATRLEISTTRLELAAFAGKLIEKRVGGEKGLPARELLALLQGGVVPGQGFGQAAIGVGKFGVAQSKFGDSQLDFRRMVLPRHACQFKFVRPLWEEHFSHLAQLGASPCSALGPILTSAETQTNKRTNSALARVRKKSI